MNKPCSPEWLEGQVSCIDGKVEEASRNLSEASAELALQKNKKKELEKLSKAIEKACQEYVQNYETLQAKHKDLWNFYCDRKQALEEVFPDYRKVKCTRFYVEHDLACAAMELHNLKTCENKIPDRKPPKGCDDKDCGNKDCDDTAGETVKQEQQRTVKL